MLLTHRTAEKNVLHTLTILNHVRKLPWETVCSKLSKNISCRSKTVKADPIPDRVDLKSTHSFALKCCSMRNYISYIIYMHDLVNLYRCCYTYQWFDEFRQYMLLQRCFTSSCILSIILFLDRYETSTSWEKQKVYWTTETYDQW